MLVKREKYKLFFLIEKIQKFILSGVIQRKRWVKMKNSIELYNSVIYCFIS